MKYLNIILIALLFTTTSCREGKASDSVITDEQTENTIKRYQVKSAKVQYKTTVSGKVMGSTVLGSGTESLYFKNWGAIELVEVNSSKTTVTKLFSKETKETTEVHTMNKLDNTKSYNVDFKRKKIYLRRDLGMEMVKTFGDGDVNKTGKKMLEGMGGKKIGEEKFLGYNCQVWTIMGGKQWMYKGLVLKLEITVMGIKTVKEAISAKFDIKVEDKYFKLPDYEIEKELGYQSDEEYEADKKAGKEQAKKMQNMTYEEFKKMSEKNDEEFKKMSEKEKKQNYEFFKKMTQKLAK